MLNVKVIGIGNCGNQVAALAHKQLKCDVFAINSSEIDLSTLPPEIPKATVGDTEGTGKNREEAKHFLKDSIMEIIRGEEFMTFMDKADVVVLVGSTGGGTGSGIVPLLSTIISSAFKHPNGEPVITLITGVFPRLKEGYSTQVNTMSYSHEIFDVMEDATFSLYDNNNVEGKAYQVLETVNQEIVDHIKVMQCQYNVTTPYDSIDEKDMKTILSTPGGVAFFLLKDIKGKDLVDKSIEDMLIEKIKKSAHVELERDGVVYRSGLITNLDPKLNEEFDHHLDKVREFIGEPTEEFLHISVNVEKSLPNNVCLILAGLSKNRGRVDKILDRISEIKDAKAGTSGESEPMISDSDLEEMHIARPDKKSSADVVQTDLEGLFSKFGV